MIRQLLGRLMPALLGVSLLTAETLPVGASVSEFAVGETASRVTVKPSAAAATVVIFVSTICPISNAYHERMSSIFKDYSDKSVQFAFVNTNSNESLEDIATHAKANRFAFSVHKDKGHELADRLGAQFTPETYVFDNTGTLRYHGYIDDSRNEARVQVQGLRRALDAVLAGKAVELKDTKAFGCTIKRTKQSS